MAFSMMHLDLDWHSLARWGSFGGLPRLFAGEGKIPALPLPRFVLRWACMHCERHFLGTDPAPQYCPRCDRPLAFVASWDLVEERAPRWWADPGERP